MPVTYAIDQAAGVIRTRCRDVLTLSEVLAHFDALAADPACPGRLDVLLDLRGVTSLPTSDMLREAAQKMRDVQSRIAFGACAIVVDSDPMHATAMLFQVSAARALRTSRIFLDLYEAERWLKTERERAREPET